MGVYWEWMLFQHYVGKTTYTIKPVQITLLPHHDISRHIVYIYLCIYYFLYTFFLAFYLASILAFSRGSGQEGDKFGSGRDHSDHVLAVEVRQGPLWSWACCSSPAGPLRSHTCSWLRSGRDHAVWSGACCSGLRGPLRSRACSWGPAGNTLILGLLFDLALAVEVRRRREKEKGEASWRKI